MYYGVATMANKRIAIVTYEFDEAVGASLALLRLKESLVRIDPTAHVVVFDVSPSPKHAGLDITVVNPVSDKISDEEFDVVLLNEPTYPLQTEAVVNNYLKLVYAMNTKKFDLWIQGEYGIVTNVAKMGHYFSKVTKMVDTVYTIAPKLEEFYRTNVEDRPDLKFGRLPGCGLINTDVEPSDWLSRKLIGYCCRITTMKKPNNFLRLMHHMGRTPSMHGKVEPGIQNVKMQSLVEEFGWNWDEIYHGPFRTTDHPTKWGMKVNVQNEYCFTWNATMIGKGNKIGVAPRIELTTIESWQGGSIPILLEETVPDYIPRECYVSVKWLDINHIGRDWEAVAEDVKTQMIQFVALDSDRRRKLCQDALIALSENWPVEESYKTLLSS